MPTSFLVYTLKFTINAFGNLSQFLVITIAKKSNRKQEKVMTYLKSFEFVLSYFYHGQKKERVANIILEISKVQNKKKNKKIVYKK